MTKVLVAYATKMGGTQGIAAAIGEVIGRSGMKVVVRNAKDLQGTDGFEAVVIGSAIYTNRWRPEAVKLLTRHAHREQPVPTWLFQSGPCGNHATTTQVPAPRRVLALATAVGASPPTTFGGRIEPATARGFIARRMAKGPLAGDFRDFDRIREWSNDVAAQIDAGRSVDH